MSITVPLYGFGTGGTSLNFEVKAYATEAELKAASPKKDTIGIITTTEITSWIFSAEKPSSPASGMVWIATASSGSVKMNALKKNGIYFCPLYAMQYVGNAWVDVDAYGFQNDTWMSFGEYLFNYGKQSYEWVPVAQPSYIEYNNQGVTPILTTNSDGSVTIAMNDGGAATNKAELGGGIYRTRDTIDLSSIKTLVVDTETSGYTPVGWHLTVFPPGSDAWGPNHSNGGDSVACLIIPSSGSFQGSLDVSSLTGEYYIGIGAHCSEYHYSYCKLKTLFMRC